MQIVVNATYGIAVAIGLYFIGVPNAILWGRSRPYCDSFRMSGRGLPPPFRFFSRLLLRPGGWLCC